MATEIKKISLNTFQYKNTKSKQQKLIAALHSFLTQLEKEELLLINNNEDANFDKELIDHEDVFEIICDFIEMIEDL